jgi:hypothetical protein
MVTAWQKFLPCVHQGDWKYGLASYRQYDLTIGIIRRLREEIQGYGFGEVFQLDKNTPSNIILLFNFPRTFYIVFSLYDTDFQKL